MNIKICICSLLFLLLSTQILYSQQAAQDTTSKLKVESSETVEGFLRKGREVRKLSGNVRLRQENTLI
jgi:hypothetical protein